MGWMSRFFESLGGNSLNRKRGRQDRWPASTIHENVPPTGPDGALQISTVWACVTLLVETLSSLPLHVYITNNGEREKVSRTFRIFNILHNSPNARQTAQEFWEQMLLNFFLRGNMYARIMRDAKGEVLSLWPMSADQVQVYQADDGSILYEQHVNGQKFIYVERDVLHIKCMGNGVVGLSPLDYMRSSLGLAVKAQDHTTKTYRNAGRRPGVLMSDVVLTDDQRKTLRENFADLVSGSDRELFILEADFKFEPLGMTPADIELLNTRKFAVQDLARWFGVPSILINDSGESSSLGSSITQIIEAFYKMKLRPQMSRVESAIEKQVLSATQRAQGMTVEFSFDALLRASLQERMEIYSRAVQNGINSRNEVRRLENLPPYDDGDVFTVQSNLISMENLDTIAQGSSVPDDPIQQ